MPRIDPHALRAFERYDIASNHGAKKLDQAEKLKTVDNDISDIQFFAKDRAGRAVPFLDADPSPVTDPAPRERILDVPAETMRALRGQPAEFAKFLDRAIDDHRAWLRPSRDQVDVPTLYKFNAVVGGRVDQFQKEAVRLAQDLYGGDRGQLNQALYAANTRTFDLFSRKMAFDDLETNGYASYGNDAPFVHVWEKRLETLNEVDPELLSPEERAGLAREKKQIQNQLDAIFASKYVFDNGNFKETDAEKRIGLVMIDRQSRQRMSETEASKNQTVPAFEILNVTHEGQDKPVFRDGDTYFFDGGTTEVPAELVPEIRRTPVDARNVTFRRAEGDEQLRDGVRFDWDKSGSVSDDVISWVSWAGHCNDKAVMEVQGVVVPRGHEGVYEYDSRSGETVHYDRDLLNEKLFSFSELGSHNRTTRGGIRDIADQVTRFAGSRDDDRPDVLHLGDRQNTRIPFSDRPNKFAIQKIELNGEAYTPEEAFRQYTVADDEMSATENPLFQGWREGDRVDVGLKGAKITADVEYQVYDDNSGYLRMERKPNTVIDFANPGDEPIVVDTVHDDHQGRKFWEISLDPKSETWTATRMEMVEKDGGGFEKKEVAGQNPIVRRFSLDDMKASRESSLDNPKEFMPFMKEVFEGGRNFVAETADGAGVWNGRTMSLEQVTVKRDDESKWAKVDLNVKARYGGNDGSFLVKLDDQGKPDFYVPLKMPFDFVWRTDMSFAPDVDGSYNEKALERGVISRKPTGGFHTEALTNMMELLHCAFNDRSYVIHHEGQRYFFESREDFEAAKQQLDQLRGAVKAPEPGPGPAPVAPGALLSVENERAAAKEMKPYRVVAQADGEIRFALNTKTGDADLYASVNGRAPTTERFDHRSWEAGQAEDGFSIQAKAGDVIDIGVHGYEASTYDLEVTGPAAQNPAPPPAGVDARLSGTVRAGEWADLPENPIRVPADGKLAFAMTGTGDADVYVSVGRAPTREAYDMRMYESGSNERATFDVKAGDEVYVRVNGYAERSDFDLRVKSE